MDDDREGLNPNAMTPRQAALLFTKLSGKQVPEHQVVADIESGTPTDEEGRVSVLTYAAWMLKEARRGT